MAALAIIGLSNTPNRIEHAGGNGNA
jgi:hypothetical protein